MCSDCLVATLNSVFCVTFFCGSFWPNLFYISTAERRTERKRTDECSLRLNRLLYVFIYFYNFPKRARVLRQPVLRFHGLFICMSYNNGKTH